MNSIVMAVALVPIGVYLVLIGSLRLRKRPLLTTGWRDTLALGIACSGLVAIGPMQLFYPAHAAARWPGWVWIMMFCLYLLCVLMWLLWSRPRLLAYGLTREQFRQALLDAAEQLDPQSAWYGEVLSIPKAGIQLASEATVGSSVQAAVAIGANQNLPDWLILERQFVSRGSRLTCYRSKSAVAMVLAGVLLVGLTALPLLRDPALASVELKRFLIR